MGIGQVANRAPVSDPMVLHRCVLGRLDTFPARGWRDFYAFLTANASTGAGEKVENGFDLSVGLIAVSDFYACGLFCICTDTRCR